MPETRFGRARASELNMLLALYVLNGREESA